jgi:GxxExxY protein
LGPGLLESAYQQCLEHELRLAGIAFRAQKPLPVIYKGLELECGYRLDFVVEDQLILEIKSVEELHPIHDAQLMTYLKLSKRKIGLLMNFNEVLLKDGIRRFVM